ncbi:MAG: hypothetical protein WCJ09_07255 [Planctomycetota bacterium]
MFAISCCRLFSVIVVVGWCAAAFAEALPEKLQQELDQGKTHLEGQYKEAKEILLKSFEKEINQTRSAPKLTAEEKQQKIGSLEAEKAILEKTGDIPFSPRMRDEAINYLNRIQKAEIALAKTYDRAIEYCTKQKDDETARDLISQKKEAVAPRVAAKWLVTVPAPPKFTWTLYTDGTTHHSVTGQKGSWSLGRQFLEVKTPGKMAPGGVWIDTCIISQDGLSFDAKNQKGNKLSAKRIITVE